MMRMVDVNLNSKEIDSKTTVQEISQSTATGTLMFNPSERLYPARAIVQTVRRPKKFFIFILDDDRASQS